MSGAFVVMAAALSSMVVVFVTVMAHNRPEEGWRSWTREAWGSPRSDDGEWSEDVETLTADGLDGLAEFAEPAGESAYVRPGALLS